jgi:hypothetical protein
MTEFQHVDAGLLLQLDDVRNRHLRPHGAVGDLKDFRRWLSQQTDIVNHAIEDLPATASAITCAGAQGWQAWKIVELAPGQTLIPAVISHDTNVVEHPELVAARGSPRSSGAENIIAKTNCGYAQRPSIGASTRRSYGRSYRHWPKRRALASKRRWP